jgi:hypothetical protein
MAKSCVSVSPVPISGYVDDATTQSVDTSPESEKVLIELLRRTPIWRQLQLAYEMSAAAREMARAGLRLCYPDASEKELRRRFADLRSAAESGGESRTGGALATGAACLGVGGKTNNSVTSC